ncbi:MAG: winged helix-turn-helix transcriptional regulator [Nitrososphaerota archaeon]|jgi:predicted transcriptional regulator|nr:winged helix-turn-helix transcriptional regulator [Nitrososphaerota archaeon]
MFLLFSLNEVNITSLATKAGLNHTSAARHLSKLVSSGLVTERRFGRVRIFSLNENSPQIQPLRRLYFDLLHTHKIDGFAYT